MGCRIADDLGATPVINPDKPEKAGAHGEETKLAHHDHPMAALCRANIRATELAADRGYIRDHNRHAGSGADTQN